jgi:hypothetical protein
MQVYSNIVLKCVSIIEVKMKMVAEKIGTNIFQDIK